MCGIAGWVSNSRRHVDEEVAERMLQILHHRGPDGHGVWRDETNGVTLLHRRLAILDLSDAGRQPMVSPCSRYVLSFNGEIYNHLEIRRDLERQHVASRWRGHSDTETLLASIVAWGLAETVNKANGMFAFALWDRQERTLSLARDRLGEKPLYYGKCGGTFVFASELKALRAHPDFVGEVDRNALAMLMRDACVQAPFSIYKGIRKLRPGHLATLQIRSHSPGWITKGYWDIEQCAISGMHGQVGVPEEDAANELERLLRQSITDQSVADVPLGAFLSGGIDSSCVVALMQSQSRNGVKTFTIGFEEDEHNEAEYAKAIAKHLGTDHTELIVRPQDAMSVIPKLPLIYCEPFGDSSQIPTFLVSQLARTKVTVALSGDGGDELFGGYNRYLAARGTWEKTRKMPNGLRWLSRAAIESITPSTWDKLFSIGRPCLPKNWHVPSFGDKLHKLASVLTLDSDCEYYRTLASTWRDPTQLVLGAHRLEPDELNRLNFDSMEHFMMAMDSQYYLPDDILVKVDRAAMANSLETRIPMLDLRVVEFAWRLPLSMKISGGAGKKILRQILKRYVPDKLFERPKTGFALPLDNWLRGSLREWADDLLDMRRLRSDGYFNPKVVGDMWEQHQKGGGNWQHHLWTVLMFQAWQAKG